uniref:Uncharacterized protein n=1 Tax=Panagrolaimus superbus TaxID=310955 RepID=A0A914YTS0_9BILA
MAPLPAQISEAIMNFQEKGTLISNRIIMQCFAPELKNVKFRSKRQTSISNEIRVESFESPENGENINDDDSDEEDGDENDDDDSLQNGVTLFVDRVSCT